jgi:small subunit ribosomal protein S3
MVIGRGGAEVDKLRKDLEAMTGRQIQVNIVEVKTPETNAQLVAESIAFALERRISFPQSDASSSNQSAIRLGAQGY